MTTTKKMNYRNMTCETQLAPVIEPNRTRLIAFVGNAQSGKMTSCNCMTGLVWKASRLVNDWLVDDTGKLVIKDLKGYTFPNGKHFDVLDWNNDDEINHILPKLSPHPMNLIQKVAFGDPLKQAIHTIFGVEPELLWGTDQQKNEDTQYTAGEFLNLIGAARFPFKHKKGSDVLTVREIMQCFGTEIIRRINPRIWVDRTVENIYSIIEQWRPQIIVCEDVRFPEELDAIKEMGGITIGLTRKPKSSAGDKHTSEQVQKLLDSCHFVIPNDNMSVQEQCLAIVEIWNAIMANK